ncbi:unnamed protein product [Rotaria sordida]|uniref:Uncharacterized protein n=1 Tax=Rotaria sordida TaxID=392033 RepID=A0A814KPA9_9BILA|nr:unnamed protein product [Rotaria sordida]
MITRLLFAILVIFYGGGCVCQAETYTCTCQCPYGVSQGIAYTTTYSTQGCVSACIAAPNTCTAYNTYACLGSSCAYSSSYTTTAPPRYTCTCQCPYGVSQGTAYTTTYSAQGCVSACIAAPNTCIASNTYACLGSLCAFSSSYG